MGKVVRMWLIGQNGESVLADQRGLTRALNGGARRFKAWYDTGDGSAPKGRPDAKFRPDQVREIKRWDEEVGDEAS